MSVSALTLSSYFLAPAQTSFANVYVLPAAAEIDFITASASGVTLRVYRTQSDYAAGDPQLANVSVPVPVSAYSGTDPATSLLDYLLAEAAAAHAAGLPYQFTDSTGSVVDLTLATAVSP